jgi:hypothetical protein
MLNSLMTYAVLGAVPELVPKRKFELIAVLLAIQLVWAAKMH